MELAVKQVILQLCDAPKRGGRVIMDDSSTLLLYDCSKWTDLQTDALRARYPEIELDVQTCEQSLSGYVVIFRLHEASMSRSNTWLVLIGLLVACFVLLLFIVT